MAQVSISRSATTKRLLADTSCDKNTPPPPPPPPRLRSTAATRCPNKGYELANSLHRFQQTVTTQPKLKFFTFFPSRPDQSPIDMIRNMSFEPLTLNQEPYQKLTVAPFEELHSKFTLFPKLPAEIRLEIWRAALPGGREVVIEMAINHTPFVSRAVTMNPEYVRSPMPAPITLRINHESRQETLKHYEVLIDFNWPMKYCYLVRFSYDENSDPHPQRILFHPELDTLVLKQDLVDTKDLKYMEDRGVNFDGVQSLKIVTPKLQAASLTTLKKSLLSALAYFNGLEELVIEVELKSGEELSSHDMELYHDSIKKWYKNWPGQLRKDSGSEIEWERQEPQSVTIQTKVTE